MGTILTSINNNLDSEGHDDDVQANAVSQPSTGRLLRILQLLPIATAASKSSDNSANDTADVSKPADISRPVAVSDAAAVRDATPGRHLDAVPAAAWEPVAPQLFAMLASACSASVEFCTLLLTSILSITFALVLEPKSNLKCQFGGKRAVKSPSTTTIARA